MSLRIQRIRLTDFRNFSDAELPWRRNDGLVGHNAVGKTNTIEALQLLTIWYFFSSSSFIRIVAYWRRYGTN